MTERGRTGVMQEPLAIKGVRFGAGRPVICVPVVERDRASIVAKVRELAEKKVRMIEWRADCFAQIDRPEAVRAVLDEIRSVTEDTVMLFTIRTKRQGGCADPGESKLLYLDEIAAGSGCIDLVDLEYFELTRPERAIRRLQQAGVHVIASHHDFARTPEDPVLYQLTDQLQKSGADIAKLAVMPDSADDLIRLLRLTADAKQKHPGLPLIMIAMGSLGVISRISGEAFGSCVSFGADGEASAPGQLEAGTLAGILDAIHESFAAGDPKMPDRIGQIYLIGFMGVGKSTVSERLKDRTNRQEIDLDEAIVRENGMSVDEMFDRFGEPYFREKETAMLQKAAGLGPAVVSCGGGCVLREENVSIIKKSGTAVLLTAEPETIRERVKDDTSRPLLKGHTDAAYIADLMEQRREAYEAAADLRIRTDKKTPDEIAGEILAALDRIG